MYALRMVALMAMFAVGWPLSMAALASLLAITIGEIPSMLRVWQIIVESCRDYFLPGAGLGVLMAAISVAVRGLPWWSLALAILYPPAYLYFVISDDIARPLYVVIVPFAAATAALCWGLSRLIGRIAA